MSRCAPLLSKPVRFLTAAAAGGVVSEVTQSMTTATPCVQNCDAVLFCTQRIMPFERMVERLMAMVPPLLDAPRSLMKGEATQIVRYRMGESYAKHFDVKNGKVAQVC